MTGVQIERTIEGLLVTFTDTVNQRAFSVELSQADAIDLGSNLLLVAALGKPADPAELLSTAWQVRYLCGCKAMAPSPNELKELCPEHGARQENPPALEAA